MAIQPNSVEFNILLVLTIIVIIAKACFTVYLGMRVYRRAKNEDKIQIDFMFGMFIMMICLMVSRILLMYFDFYLTQFDQNKFYLSPNIEIWKTATFIMVLGFVILGLIMDKKVLQFKFKGIPAIILLIIGLIQFLYPVDSMEDFQTISALGIIQMLTLIWIPIIFLIIGIKTPGLRKTCFIIIIAIVIYAGGGVLVGEHFLEPLRQSYGDQIHVVIFFVFVITKIVGLSMLSYASTKFSV